MKTESLLRFITLKGGLVEREGASGHQDTRQDVGREEKQAHESVRDTVCKLEVQLQEMMEALEAQRLAVPESCNLCHQLKQQFAVETQTEHKSKPSQEEVQNCQQEGQNREHLF